MNITHMNWRVENVVIVRTIELYLRLGPYSFIHGNCVPLCSFHMCYYAVHYTDPLQMVQFFVISNSQLTSHFGTKPWEPITLDRLSLGL